MREKTEASWTDFVFWPKPKSAIPQCGFFELRERTIPTQTLCDESLPREGFCLTVSPDAVTLTFGGKRGSDYGLRLCNRISRHFSASGRIPCITVTDAPDIPVRGFMLDISRGRVPTLARLEALISQLAELRYNQLQLYIEHTYAFAKHPTVWREASPLTAEDLGKIQALCDAHHIEFVPNLNSFGHVERWLKHAPYKHLAECPDGFFHELFQMQRAAGTFAANRETADFMGTLYEEFLPHFRADKFNIGGDEPWELGIGRSRGICEKAGKRAVYIEHMTRLKKHVATHAKKMMFWGDVLLGETGEIPADFLENTIPVIWGYDAGHPFDKQCRCACESLAQTSGDKEFYLAPGTSSWLSFGTRQTNALKNIREACAAAHKYRATGILLTTWGDFGYHNTPSADALPLFFAAQTMWNANATYAPENLPSDFCNFFGEMTLEQSRAFFEFGNLDSVISKKIANRSLIREVFFASGNALEKVLAGSSAEEIERAKQIAESIAATATSENTGSDLSEDFCLAADMARAALRKADAFLKQNFAAFAAANTEIAGTLRSRFEQHWLRTCRPGGLQESLSYFPK